MINRIKNIKILLLVFGFCLALMQNGNAQIIYPVTNTLQAIPPFTPYLNDYASPVNNKLIYTLIMNDNNETFYQGRLKISIEGNGITLTTKNDFLPPPIRMNYAMPVQLSGMDLAPYFNPNNLDFQGLTYQDFIRTGRLPDGNYTLCIQAFDYKRSEEKPISNEVCTNLFIIEHDPPVIVTPIGEITPTQPQNLPFTWERRHIGAFPVEYTLEVYEYNPQLGLTMDLTIATTPVIFKKTISNLTTIPYGPLEPTLKVGQKYLQQVQVKDITGLNHFKNNGYSQVEIFTYGGACALPQNISSSVDGSTSATISWDAITGAYAKYTVRYKDKEFPNASWYEETTFSNSVTLSNLESGTTYLFQVQNDCGGYESELSPRDEFVLEEEAFDPDSYQCGDQFEIPEVTNTEDILLLGPGDIVNIGGFKLQITEYENNDGRYTGAGRVKIDFLNFWVYVEFEDLGINTDRQVYEGEVTATSTLEEFDPEALIGVETTFGDLENFCKQTVDENGFDPNGVHAETNSEYGPDGFNAKGCNAQGQNREGGACADEEETGFLNIQDQMAEDALACNCDAETLAASLEESEYQKRMRYMKNYQQGQARYQLVVDENRILSTGGSGSNDPKELPLGVQQDSSNSKNLIVFDNMVFTTEGASLDAYFTLIVPTTGDSVIFSAKEIGFNPTGVEDDGRMELTSNVSVVLGNNMLLTLKGENNGTFVSWDCKGFEEVHIDGDIEFCREFVIPVDETGAPLEDPERVKASFTTSFKEWDDFAVTVDVTPFQVARLDSVIWRVEEAVFDFSSTQTPDMVLFPDNYEHPDVNFEEESFEGWKGLYMKRVSVKLPEHFEDGETVEESEIGAENLIIDNTGFTSDLFATSVIDIEKGTIGNWAFSIDSFAIRIQSNDFQSVYFAGEIEVPIFKDSTGLEYAAYINPGCQYNFEVTLLDTIELALWKARSELYPNSTIAMGYGEEDGFTAEASLYGIAEIDVKFGKKKKDDVKMKGVHFEGLTVRTAAPYIEFGTWGLLKPEGPEEKDKEDGLLSKIPLTINDFQLKTEDDRVGLYVNASVTLMGSEEGGFGGEGGLTIWGKREESTLAGFIPKYAFDGVEVESFEIEASGPAFSLEGSLEFYESDPLFGSGIRGKIDASFEPGLSVEAIGQFGRVNDYNYFFVDAMLRADQGIAIANTGLALFGFGGGLYHHMSQASLVTLLPDENGDTPEIDEESELGVSLSGTRYLPDENTFLGLKATVAIGTIRPEAFNADVTFEIAFRDNGGVRMIGFEGDAYFMTPPKADREDASVRASLDMTYDFENTVLHADMTVYVNVYGGAIAGAYENNKVGDAVLHFESTDHWYIHIGHPDTRLAVNVQIPGLEIELAQFTAYLCAGTELPPMPALPTNVSSIIGDLDLARDEAIAGNGGGFMFGAAFDAQTGNQEFAMFYGRFGAGIGFDVMMKNYGEEVTCKGQDGPIGIDGWYASGQMWAYVDMEIGIHVDLLGYEGDYSIIEAAMAAALQAELPNPVWARGVVGGRYSILGGLVSGDCKFDFELGDRCEMVGGSPLAGIKVIQSVTPAEAARDVDVFNTPQASFNLQLDREFELRDRDGNEVAFRAKLDYFTVKATGNTTKPDVVVEAGPIVGELVWNAEKDVVAFESFDILPGFAEIELDVRVIFEKKVFGGVWTPLIVNGKEAEERYNYTFETGEAPDYIPHNNIEYAYPLLDQYHFLKDEASDRQAYISLKRGQPYLFTNDPDFNKVVRFISTGPNESLTSESASLNYDSGARLVTYNIPNNLVNQNVYRINFVNVPTQENVALDANATVKEVDLSGAGGTGAAVVKVKELEGTKENFQEKNFFESHFRTSVHSTFNQKLDALAFDKATDYPLRAYRDTDPTKDAYNGIYEIRMRVSGNEVFDKFEISGDEVRQLPALIQYEAGTAAPWFQQDLNPTIYDHFPDANVDYEWRTEETYGRVPVGAMDIRQENNARMLGEEDVVANTVGNPIAPDAQFIYNVDWAAYKDYLNFLQQVTSKLTYLENLPSYYTEYAETPYPFMRTGDYPIDVNYTLPGKTTPTTTRTLIMKRG